MRPLMLILAVLLSTPCTTVIAQGPPLLERGQRVRVSSPAAFGDDRQVARFEALRGDTLVVTVDSLTHVLPFGVVNRLEVSRGRKSRVMEGAVGGGVVLGCLGLLAATTNPFNNPNSDELTLGVVTYTAIGAGIGALLGAAIRSDRWDEVPLDRLLPQRDVRFGLGLSLRF